MLRTSDPIVATLQFAYREVVENEYTDPELAIAAAAFVLYGPDFDYLAVSQEATKYHRANRTFGNAIRAARDNRRRSGLFGTYNVPSGGGSMVDTLRPSHPEDEPLPDDETEALQDQYDREHERQDRNRRDRGYY